MTDLVPKIIAQSKDLPTIFEKIDQLEVCRKQLENIVINNYKTHS